MIIHKKVRLDVSNLFYLFTNSLKKYIANVYMLLYNKNIK